MITEHIFTQCWEMIERFYHGKHAERSELPYMNHIDEGVVILDRLNACDITQAAFCIHPIVQADEDLQMNLNFLESIPTLPLVLAMEYRSVANAYLSTRTIESIDEITLSCIPEVNLMLIADKVQNRKDFLRHQKETHPRSAELNAYFNNWLEALGVTTEQYDSLIIDLDMN